MKDILKSLSLLIVNLRLVFSGISLDNFRAFEINHVMENTEVSKSMHLPNFPLDFIKNQGQWEASTEFMVQNGQLTALIQEHSIQLYLNEMRSPVGLTFEDASSNVTLTGEEKRSNYYNFFIGNDPQKWQSKVSAYSSILYQGLYDGIDMRLREQNGELEYDLLLAPKTDLAEIVIRADGILSMELASDGALILQTAAGPLRQPSPLTWEVLPNGIKHPVKSAFRIIDSQRYGFS